LAARDGELRTNFDFNNFYDGLDDEDLDDEEPLADPGVGLAGPAPGSL